MSVLKTNAEYAKCEFLIYSCWTSRLDSGSKISGSLLLDGAYSEEEAVSLVELFKERAAANEAIYKSNTLEERRYIHIPNRKEWWR